MKKAKWISKIFGIALVFVMLTSTLGGLVWARENDVAEVGYVDDSVEQAKEIIDSDPDTVALDVRTEDEYEPAHIAGTELAPLSELEQRTGELDKDAARSSSTGDQAGQGCSCADSQTSTTSASDNSLISEIDNSLDSNKPVFLFFYADWCHFCQQQKPLIDELEQVYADDVAFIRVNGPDNPEATNEFGVTAFPSMFFILVRNAEGYVGKGFSGFTTKEVLEESLNPVVVNGLLAEASSYSNLALAGAGSGSTCNCPGGWRQKPGTPAPDPFCHSPVGDNPTLMACFTLWGPPLDCSGCSFTSACIDHNRCYDTCVDPARKVKARLACDQAFLKRMKSVCQSCPKKNECMIWANIYYSAVRSAGASSYDEGQGKGCESCQCCDPKSCDDGDDCTADYCEGTECRNSPIAGCDHPDDNFDVSSGEIIAEQALDSQGEPAVAVLRMGDTDAVQALLASLGEPTVVVDTGFSPELVHDYPVLVIPSGGLYGIDSLKSFKQRLGQYVANGGTLIVFSQQHGYEYNALPGGEVSGYGWLEDQSCQYGSVGISTYHPILSRQDSVTSDVNVDGYFTSYPDNSTVLLSRTKNGMPAMLMYKYGDGHVIATTAYTDWAYMKGQASTDEENLVRDMISWAKEPQQIAEYGLGDTIDTLVVVSSFYPELPGADHTPYVPGDLVTVPIEATNSDNVTADRVTYLLISPDYETVESSTLVSVPPGATVTIYFSYATTESSTTGVYFVAYYLYAGDTLVGGGLASAFGLGVDLSVLSNYQVTFTLKDPNKNVIDYQTVAVTVPLEETGSVPFTYANLSQLGIWSLEYEILDYNDMLLESGMEGFAVSKYAENPDGWVYQGKNIAFAVSSPEERYAYGSDVPFTIHVWNNGDTDRSISFSTYYKDWMLSTKLPEQNVDGTLDVPAGGEATFTHTLHVGDIYLSQNQLIIYATFSEDGNNLGRTEKVIWMFSPSIDVSVSTDKQEYVKGEDVSILLSLKNKRSAIYDVSAIVRVLDAENSKVFEESFDVTLSGDASHEETFSFSLSTTYGVYVVSAEAYVGGNKVGSGSTYFEVVKDYLVRVAFDHPDNKYRARESMGIDLEAINAGATPWSSIVNISIPVLGFSDSVDFVLDSGQTEQVSYNLSVPEDITAGKHEVILTVEFDNSTEEYYFFIPQSELVLTTDRTSYDAGENLSINLSNLGGVDTTGDCSIKFYDSYGFMIYEGESQESVQAGESKTLEFIIPEQTVGGDYYLTAWCKDLSTDKVTRLAKSCTVEGLKASLTSVTDKKTHFTDEDVSISTNITNLDGAIVNGTLNLKIFSGVPTDLTNIGFETGDLTGWTVGTETEFVGVIDTETFTDENTGELVTVDPRDGKYMVRLGNTFPKTPQPIGPNELVQTFNVTGSSLTFAYNIFTYDYQGFDFFGYELIDTAGNVIEEYHQTAWGEDGDTSLKSTGWRDVDIDVSDHMGETITLRISVGGTLDDLYRQWVYIDSSGYITYELLWEKDITANLAESAMENIVTTINISSEIPNVTGKLGLIATLYASSSQIIDQSTKHSFFITGEDTSFTMETDKEVYKSNEAITTYGEVQNNAEVANDYSLAIKKDGEEIFSESFTLAPGESHSFTTGTSSENSFTLEGTVDGITIADFITIEYPNVDVTIIAPDVVGLADFDVGILVENIASVDCDISVTLADEAWDVLIPAGESRLMETTMSITQDTTLSVIITGDVEKTVQKDIIMGEDARIEIAPQNIYLEGTVEIPFTVENTGVLDTEFEATFSISSSEEQTIVRTLFIPQGESIADTLSLELTQGLHLLQYGSPFEEGAVEVRVGVPGFVVTELPSNLNLTCGQEVTWTFRVGNIGGAEGEAHLYLMLPDWEETNFTWVRPGQEEEIAFSFIVPDDLEEKEYKAIYELNGARDEFFFFVHGAKVIVNASLDKPLYEEDETAILTLNVANDCAFNLSLYARTQLHEYEEIQPFELTDFATLQFNIPVTFNDNKLFYGIYMESGRALYLNSMYVHKKGDIISLYTDKQVYFTGETVTVFVNTTQSGILNITAPGYAEELTTADSTVLTFTLPELRSGTYYIDYTFDGFSSSYPFDVIGYSARIIEFGLDKESYSPGELILMEANVEVNRNVTGLLRVRIYDPEHNALDEFDIPVTLVQSENAIKAERIFLSDRPGIHSLVYQLFGDLAGHSLVLLSSGAEYFDGISGNTPPIADAGPDQTVCVISPATTAMVMLDGSGSHDADGDPLTYTWTWDGNTAHGVNPTVELPLGITTITLVVNDGKADSEPDTVNITVNPKPVANASSNSPVSQGATIQLTGGPDGMESYSWTGPNSLTSNSQNPTIPNATKAMEGTYTLTVTNSNGCTDDDTTNVEVRVPVVPPAGGGGGGGGARYLTVDWEGTITSKPLYSNDRLAEDLLGPSPDGSHSLLLERGTLAPTVDGKRYYLIVIRELEEIPPLPENTVAIVAFNITPVGSVFDRDIFLTLGLDQSQLPENTLNVTIAYYDDAKGAWAKLESEAGGPNGVAELTLSAPINHFSIFGVLAELAPTLRPPAHFVPSGLSIVTSVERLWEPITFVTKTGESVTITANVANDGGQEGTYTVELKLNGETVDTRIVTLGAGQTQQVSFTVSEMDYGQYEVEVAGLSGEFTTSRTITWWLIIGIIVAIGLISWGVVWGRRRRRRAAQEG